MKNKLNYHFGIPKHNLYSETNPKRKIAYIIRQRKSTNYAQLIKSVHMHHRLTVLAIASQPDHLIDPFFRMHAVYMWAHPCTQQGRQRQQLQQLSWWPDYSPVRTRACVRARACRAENDRACAADRQIDSRYRSPVNQSIALRSPDRYDISGVEEPLPSQLPYHAYAACPTPPPHQGCKSSRPANLILCIK